MAPVEASVIPQKWQEYFQIPFAPARTVYFGGDKEISHDPNNPSSEHAHFVVWGKFVYHDPQKLADKTFVTELVGVHIDCPKEAYSQFRDIKLDANENMIADSAKFGKFQAIPRNVHLGLLDPAAATASGALSFTCGMDED